MLLFFLQINTLSQISHVGTSDLLAAPDPVFELVDAVVVVFESCPSTFTMVILLFGFAVVCVTVLAVVLRTVVLVCAVLVLVVKVVAFDNVGSLKICGLLTGLVSFFSGDDCSTLILWNVIADVSGSGSVIFAGATFCSVVKCTLPSDAFN